MDIRTKLMLYFVVCTFLFWITGGIDVFKDKKVCYSIEIEFTDGTKRTVQFESIERPKVTDEGCMYDHSKKSWICGCRDIQYKECSK